MTVSAGKVLMEVSLSFLEKTDHLNENTQVSSYIYEMYRSRELSSQNDQGRRRTSENTKQEEYKYQNSSSLRAGLSQFPISHAHFMSSQCPYDIKTEAIAP